MKIATWNVNSLNVRLNQVVSLLDHHQPDILALQETKLIDEKFPEEDFKKRGYNVSFSGQKTYNGVAIISKLPLKDTVSQLPNFEDTQRRLLSNTIGDLRIVNVYVPNGSEVGSEKYEYKLVWLDHLRHYLEQELAKYKQVIVLGDFNIAPNDQDVCDPKAWSEGILCSVRERKALEGLLFLGFVDLYRHLFPEGNAYTWWDYRTFAFRRNAGLRIDLILGGNDVVKVLLSCEVDKSYCAVERPSDHAPVIVEIE